jgi:hypothetical protein
MSVTQKKNDLRLVRDDDRKTERWQLEGYQRMDDRIVMYRRYIPVTRELNTIMMQIFDFNSYQATVVIDTKGYDSKGAATALQVMGFSTFENKQAIKDAHQALCDLGGNPPPLSIVLGDPSLD